jgi:hypothetical protein
MKAYTDYPIVELGDTPNQIAPIRECNARSYDGDKYCVVAVEGILTTIKAGYLYQRPGRLGEVPPINTKELPRQ